MTQTNQDIHHCGLLMLLQVIKNVENGAQMEPKVDQKTKIGHIEDNNKGGVP